MFRTALRSSAGATFRRQAVAQRFASSSSGSKKPASDATWAIGSAAFFGTTTAYLLATSGTKAHPAEAAVHSTTNMKIADATAAAIPAEEAPKQVNTKAETNHKGSGRQIEDLSAGIKEKQDGETPDSTGDDKEEESSAPAPSEDDEPKSTDSESKSADSDEEGRKAEDIPASELASKAAQEGLKKAESVAVPKIAMGGNDEGSDSSTDGKMEASDEGRLAEDIPSSEIQDSLHQAEEACVPKATWAHDGKAE